MARASVVRLPLLLFERDMRVRVYSSLFRPGWNSQHGRTMCPDGASSSWKVSVPVGSDLSMS